VSQEEADRTFEVLLENGINHLDVAASYGDGEAEKRMGPWMAEHRKDFFLATKTGKRTYRQAFDDLRGSLERLRVDSVDLVQLHNLTDPDEWEQALSSGGAVPRKTWPYRRSSPWPAGPGRENACTAPGTGPWMMRRRSKPP